MAKGLKPVDLSMLDMVATPDPSTPEEIRPPGKVLSAKDVKPSTVGKALAEASSFPSREAFVSSEPEAVRRTQINSYLTAEAGAEFKALCKRERYSYGEMIEIMMRHFLDTRN